VVRVCWRETNAGVGEVKDHMGGTLRADGEGGGGLVEGQPVTRKIAEGNTWEVELNRCTFGWGRRGRRK